MSPHSYSPRPDDDDDIDPRELVQWLFRNDIDPLNHLEVMGHLQQLLSEMEDDAVLRARVEGASWSQIGTALRRTKQAVWEKHRDPQDGSPDDDVWLVPGPDGQLVPSQDSRP